MKAAARVDVGAAIYAGKRLPCICPQQDHGRTVSGDHVTLFRDRQGLPIAHVECSCGRRWKRVSA